MAKLLPGPDASAYTDGDAIIKIAKDENAQAIIPGYGFLSENADFARDVGKAGIVWVGPSPEAIEVKYRKTSNWQVPTNSMASRPLVSSIVSSATGQRSADSRLTFFSVARDLAEKAGVPIVPGTKGLVESADEAAQESERLGFPVMLKGMSSLGLLPNVISSAKRKQPLAVAEAWAL